MLTNLLNHLYAHTTMTLDDILFVAKNNGITIDASVEDKMAARKDGEEITFDATCNNGLIYILIFDVKRRPFRIGLVVLI